MLTGSLKADVSTLRLRLCLVSFQILESGRVFLRTGVFTSAYHCCPSGRIVLKPENVTLSRSSLRSDDILNNRNIGTSPPLPCQQYPKTNRKQQNNPKDRPCIIHVTSRHRQCIGKWQEDHDPEGVQQGESINPKTPTAEVPSAQFQGFRFVETCVQHAANSYEIGKVECKRREGDDGTKGCCAANV